MAKKALPPPPAPPAEPMTRDAWNLAFARRVGELRGDMGSRYLATIAATLYPKHRDDDPEQVATDWYAQQHKD